jgi:hypothetical protein
VEEEEEEEEEKKEPLLALPPFRRKEGRGKRGCQRDKTKG